MLTPKTSIDPEAIEKAKTRQGVCWGEEYERMISGMMYSPIGPELIEGRTRARLLMAEFNAPPAPEGDFWQGVSKTDTALRKLFGRAGKGIYVEPPLRVDYGCNISVGDCFYANFNLTVLDCGLVTIGNYVEIGPNVSIITGEHETEINRRRANRGKEFTGEVIIGDECWIGAGVIILAGVTIGMGCTIGAGAVVKNDIPPFSIAVGVPARVIRSAGTPDETTTEGQKEETGNGL